MELIPNLCTNAANDNVDIRNASLQTLQMICEDLGTGEVTDELKNLIILALSNNIFTTKETEKTTLFAIKGLFFALPHASQNFKVSQERDYIMQKVFEALLNDNEDIRTTAMQTLVEIGRQEYQSVQFYLPKIWEVTAGAAKTDVKEVGAQAIEFWTSLAEEEIKMKKRGGQGSNNYIAQCHNDLVGLLLECTQNLTIEDEDDDSDEWGVSLSASCCLDKVA